MAKKKSKPKMVEHTWENPLWKGPHQDGITFSLLVKFLECRERFRLKVVEGLTEDEGFNHHLEFGSIWHEGEEAVAEGKAWKPRMKAYAGKLMAKWPEAEDEINKWVSIATHVFPAYLAHWENHPDTRRRKYYLHEQGFRVPYRLPSGRVLMMRGKIDGGFMEKAIPYIQENKTKGKIYEEGILGGLPTNLQTMWYFIAHNKMPKMPTAKGVLYNVIRRPLSERHPIRPRKNESTPQFHKRIRETVEANPNYYFMRWKAIITPIDVAKMKRWCINPILESLMDWWEWITTGEPWRIPTKDDLERCPRLHPNLPGGGIHWRFPFGAYHQLASGWEGSFFHLLCHGSRRNVTQAETLFPEL